MRPPYDLSHRSIGLTCGYHESCKRLPWRTPPYLTGKAIDWDDNGGTVPNSRAVYFTASAQATTTAPIALVTFRFYPAGSAPQYPCHTLVATVHNYADRAPLFTVVYEHVRPLPNLHSLVVRGNGAGPLSLNRAHATPATSVPNVVARIGTMADDPCPYYQRDALGRPLYHAHVGAGTVARNVGFWMNTERWSSGIRAIPDANGCGAACTSTYPGPRWRLPYWQLWTYMWHWQVRVPTGRIA
jgi:hypothetical protein